MDAKNSAMETDSLQNNVETSNRLKYEALFNDSDDDSIPEIECDLCSKTFSSVKAYEQHLSGKKHHQMLSKKKILKKARTAESGEENVDPDSAAELQCDVCEKTFSGYKPYAAHLKGSIHAKNVKLQKLKESMKEEPEVLAENGDGVESEDDDLLPKPFARCSVCQKKFYDPSSYQKHKNGSAHKKKMLQQRTLDGLKHEFQDNPQADDEEFFTKCEICNKQFSGPVPFKIHLKSAVHENHVKRAQAMEKLKDFILEDSPSGKLVCKECKKVFSDPFALKQHLENNSHEKQKVKDKVLEFVTANPEVVAMKSVENISSEGESDENAGYEKGYYFLVCKLCHTSFTGLESAKDHVLSKKHIKAKDEKKNVKLLKKKLTEKKGDKDAATDMNGHVKGPASTSADDVSKMEIRHEDGNDDFELV